MLPPDFLFLFCCRVLRQEPVEVSRRVCDRAARGVDGIVLEQHRRDVAASAKTLIEVIVVAVVRKRQMAEILHVVVSQCAVSQRSAEAENELRSKFADSRTSP